MGRRLFRTSPAAQPHVSKLSRRLIVPDRVESNVPRHAVVLLLTLAVVLVPIAQADEGDSCETQQSWEPSDGGVHAPAFDVGDEIWVVVFIPGMNEAPRQSVCWQGEQYVACLEEAVDSISCILD